MPERGQQLVPFGRGQAERVGGLLTRRRAASTGRAAWSAATGACPNAANSSSRSAADRPSASAASTTQLRDGFWTPRSTWSQ